jgi:hypothetical protein
MGRFRSFAALTAATSLLIVASGCRGNPSTQSGSTASPPPKIADEEDPFPLLEFDPSAFDSTSHQVDNKWFPYEPGIRTEHEGSSIDEGERVSHRIVLVVTDMTKVIQGVRARMAWERDYDGENRLRESELVFFAQDKEGNVWHLGQYRETYDEDGEFVGGRVWLVGLFEGTKAGIYMKADPKPGERSHSQGYAPPPFGWDDRARVFQVGQKTCVKAGCYEDVLVMDEFEPTKPGAHQLKYYAAGIGGVRVGWAGEKEEEKEEVELVKRFKLSSDEMEKARAEWMQLESRAYDYSKTTPAERG